MDYKWDSFDEHIHCLFFLIFPDVRQNISDFKLVGTTSWALLSRPTQVNMPTYKKINIHNIIEV